MLKLFPGYGNNRDTHVGTVVDKRPLETFQERDFLPFEAGAKAGVGAVMVSHNIVECFDAEFPASLTPLTIQALRGLGFDGVVATDGLDMKAVKEDFSTERAVVMAVQAGNDMMLMSKYATGIKGILEAVKDGRILESRIDESVRRILKWKQALGLIPGADGVAPSNPN
jgi:beta-N-acetylhexosaminidase